MRLVSGAMLVAVLASACSGTATQTEEIPSSVASATATATAEATPTPSATATTPAGSGIDVDMIVRTTVEDLTVRSEPSSGAEDLGTIPAGVRAFVVAGPTEADGYEWYQVAGVDEGTAGGCDQDPRPLHCVPWFGWVAGTSADGDPWLEPVDLDCPSAGDTEAYLSVDPATRLACAGDDEWRLVTYLAPGTAGRGCLPVWVVDPFWMEPACNFFFPQPVESEFDTDTRIQAFVPPELGACGPGGCPFDDLKGSWVELVGHLDDGAAQSCVTVLSESVGAAPEPQPDPDATVLRCRMNFILTDVIPTDPPAGSSPWRMIAVAPDA